MPGRFFTLKDYPNPDQDKAGQLVLYVSSDDCIDECDDEPVVVKAEGNGWREVVGAYTYD